MCIRDSFSDGPDEGAAGSAGLHQQDDDVDDADFFGVYLRHIQYGICALLVCIEPVRIQPDEGC